MSTRSYAKTKHGLIIDANACARAKKKEPHTPMIVADRVPNCPLSREIGIRTFEGTKRGRKRFRDAKIKAKQRKVRESGESVARRRVAFFAVRASASKRRYRKYSASHLRKILSAVSRREI